MKAHRHSMRMKHKKKTDASPKTDAEETEGPDGLGETGSLCFFSDREETNSPKDGLHHLHFNNALLF